MNLKCFRLTFVYLLCIIVLDDGSPRYRASPMNIQLTSEIGSNFASVLLLVAKYFHQCWKRMQNIRNGRFYYFLVINSIIIR